MREADYEATMSGRNDQPPKLGDTPWFVAGPDDVELNSFNGRPSAGLVATESGALLFWQLFGHGTDIGLWLYLPLTDAEAEHLVDHPDEPMLDGLRGELVGRQGVLALSGHGQVLARGPYRIAEAGDHPTFIRQILKALARGLSNTGAVRPSRGGSIEVAPDSADATAEARDLVHGTLAGCPG